MGWIGWSVGWCLCWAVALMGVMNRILSEVRWHFFLFWKKIICRARDVNCRVPSKPSPTIHEPNAYLKNRTNQWLCEHRCTDKPSATLSGVDAFDLAVRNKWLAPDPACLITHMPLAEYINNIGPIPQPETGPVPLNSERNIGRPCTWYASRT